MNFTVQDLKHTILFTGTKQDCMHFIKCRKLDRQKITIQKFDDTPSYHTAIPVTADVEPPKGFLKRIFSK